jgi:5'-nucleotidase
VPAATIVINLTGNPMQILVTNDDGISAPGLWTLVRELKSVARVVVVAPDREQSATGTAVTLRQPLRVQKVTPMVTDVEAYSVEGTPCDSVILALGKLMKNRSDMVISGINQGPNLGDDILISGTVGAALQGYLRGLPSLAISVANAGKAYLDNAAKLAILLAKRIDDSDLLKDIFLNINLPDLPLAEIKGIKITQPAHKSHIDTVEEGHDGRQKYYWLVRQKLSTNTDESTDIQALEQGNISITALHKALFGKPLSSVTEELCFELFQELRQA